jgi:DNA-binding NarL/FixJ family response regulator
MTQINSNVLLLDKKVSDKLNIIRLLANGKSSKEISIETSLNTRTVEARIKVLKKDWHCKTSIQLVSKLFKFGILTADDINL